MRAPPPSRRLGPAPLPLRGIPPTAGPGSGPRRRLGRAGRRVAPGWTGHGGRFRLPHRPHRTTVQPPSGRCIFRWPLAGTLRHPQNTRRRHRLEALAPRHRAEDQESRLTPACLMPVRKAGSQATADGGIHHVRKTGTPRAKRKRALFSRLTGLFQVIGTARYSVSVKVNAQSVRVNAPMRHSSTLLGASTLTSDPGTRRAYVW